ncbi:MAG: tetratricopeptide repeat protein, partial [Planctomycetota bacterium]
RNKEYLPSSYCIPVLAAKGWNQILLKLPRAYFTLRISDTEGNPVTDLNFEKEKIYRRIASKFKQTLTDISYNSGALAYYKKLVEKQNDNAVALCALSYLLGRENLYVDALEEAKKAAELAPENLNVLYLLAAKYENAYHISSTMKSSKARDLYNKILKKDPDFIPASEAYTKYLMDDDKIEKAIDEYEKIFKGGFAYPITYVKLMSIYLSQNWEYEALTKLKELEKIDPASKWLTMFNLRYYYSIGNREKAYEYEKKLNQIDKADNRFKYISAERCIRLGELEKALEIYMELVKDEPDNTSNIDQIASIYRNMGRVDDAVAQYKKLLEIYPDSSFYYTTIGNIYREQGKIEEAVDFYEKVLILNPGNSNLRTYVNYLRGEKEDFSREFSLSDKAVAELIAQAGDKSKYPKAKNLMVLDETITLVQPDGSCTSTVHCVHKILDYSGKDAHATPYWTGEVEEMQTILPDGTTLEPVAVNGVFTMPGLCENACIEYKYTVPHSGEKAGGRFETAKFYYQDLSLDEPFVLSRQVVIVKKRPQDKKSAGLLSDLNIIPYSVLDEIQVIQKNIPEDKIEFKRIDREDSTVFMWEAHDMPRVEEEKSSPNIDEFLPFSYLTTTRTWKDFYEDFKDEQILTTIKPTPLLIAKAKELSAGKISDINIVKALYEFCHKEIKSGGGSSEAHAVLLEKQGDRNYLFLALLRACGISFEVLPAGNDPLTLSPPIEWEIPRSRYFPNRVVRIKLKGINDIWMSLPNTRYMPLGKIPKFLQGAPVFLTDSKNGSEIIYLPRESSDELAVTETISINLAKLTATGSVNTKNYENKERYKDASVEERKKRLQRIANSFFPGAVLNVKESSMPDLDVIGKPLEYIFACTTPNFLTVKKETGEITAKTGMDPLNLQSSYIEKPERELPLFIDNRTVFTSDVTIDLAGKYELEKLPEDTVLSTEFGHYALTFHTEDGKIRVNRTFNMSPQRIQKEKYPEFIKFCTKIDETEIARIILTKIKD